MKIYRLSNSIKWTCYALFLLSLGGIVGQTPVQKYGQLKVQGNKIVDQNNAAAQLRGMSLFWSQWIGKYYTYNTVKWLRDDWCTSVVRAAMAVDNEGYVDNPEVEKAKVFTVIDAAIDLGIYVIVDFHVHEANLYKNEAKTFFTEVAQKYGHQPNIIYEIWNEPLDVSWADVIKPYHNELVATIRQYDADNIIVCGTRSWSQRVDEAANNPVAGTNIAYTLHYYADTHGQSYRDMCSAALSKNAAVFVTEYGTCRADGAGNVNASASNAWWSYLDQNKISYCNWSIADKVEAASALQPNASINGNWTTSDLTTSGTLVRNYYKSKCDFTPPKNITTQLLLPTNNSSYTLGATVTASATAKTSQGTITKVEFYLDDVLVGTLTQEPYTLALTSVGIGKHSLFAKVYNSLNENTTTAAVSIEVETPVFKTTTAPLIDGVADGVWANDNVPKIAINRGVTGMILSPSDLSGNFKALWDASYLYVLGTIVDEKKVNESAEVYNDDGLEVFVDINNDKATSYGANDVQYTFGWNDGTLIASNPSGRATTGISYAMVESSNGYIFEARIPWTTLKGTPAVGQKVGFDLHINDDDDGDERDAKLAWTSTSDDTWQNPSLLGTIVLQDVVPCPLPTGTGTIAGPSAVCLGAEASYTLSGVTGATAYAWTLPTGMSIKSGGNTTAAVIIAGGTDGNKNIVVTPSNVCGNGTVVSIPVTVNPLPSFIITTPATTLCDGQELLLTAPVGADFAYVWKRNDVVVGTAPSYKAKEGGSYTLEITDTKTSCKATSTSVSLQLVSVPTVSITSPTQSIYGGPATFALEASVLGTNISKVAFYRDNTLLVEDLQAPYSTSIQALPTGEYNFRAIAFNTSNCSDTAEVSVKAANMTDLQENNLEATMALFPNPFDDHCTLSITGAFEYKILTLDGKIKQQGEAQGQVSLGAELSKGLYILEIQQGIHSKHVKLEKY